MDKWDYLKEKKKSEELSKLLGPEALILFGEYK